MINFPGLFFTRRFLPLFLTQFLGAFNDNAFKNALVMLIAYRVASHEGGEAQIMITLAAGLFILPFFLFSATAGQLADKYDRARIARIVKLAEIAIMAVAVAGLYAANAGFLLFVLFCLGAQSTFFGPVKYALLPQHLHEHELIEGNGYIEAGTFLAILLGTIVGGLLILRENGVLQVSLTVMLAAVFGYASSRYIPVAPGSQPELKIGWNVARETWRIIQYGRKSKRVFRSIIGISWFWLVGATFLSQFPTYARDVLSGDETVVTLLLTVFSVGIGIGSTLCNRLLKGEVSSRLVPWAAWGITLFTVDLFFASRSMGATGEMGDAWGLMEQAAAWRILFDLTAIAVCGGLYIVPLYAIMQHESDVENRARIIASNNVLNALFMVLAALVTVGLLSAQFTVSQVFLSMAVLNGVAAIYVAKLRRHGLSMPS